MRIKRKSKKKTTFLFFSFVFQQNHIILNVHVAQRSRARSKRLTSSVRTAFELRADDERGRSGLRTYICTLLEPTLVPSRGPHVHPPESGEKFNKIYKRSVLQVSKANVLQGTGRSTAQRSFLESLPREIVQILQIQLLLFV